MLFLLPPSESKLDGGSGASGLDLTALSYPELTDVRRETVTRLVDLSRDDEVAMTALKIGPRLVGEVERNRRLLTSPTMPALARYTGVLFDPVGANELDEAAWAWAARHVVVHSALFGPVGAADPVPAYRLSHDSRLPGRTLRATWSRVVSEALSATGEFVVDLRSEGYVALGPLDPSSSSYVRVVSAQAGGRALNHFNKKSKGVLVALLLRDRPRLDSLDDLVDWARTRDVVLEPGVETRLVSESVLAHTGQVTGTGPAR